MLVERLSSPALHFADPQAFACRRGDRGGQARREDERPGVVHEELHQHRVTRHEPALGAVGLRQGADQHHIAAGDHARRGQRAAPVGADGAATVRIVDDQHRVVRTGDRVQGPQVCQVCVHAEDALGDDVPLPGTRGRVEAALQIVWITVCEANQRRSGKPDAVDDARVHECIGEHRVMAPGDRGQ